MKSSHLLLYKNNVRTIAINNGMSRDKVLWPLMLLVSILFKNIRGRQLLLSRIISGQGPFPLHHNHCPNTYCLAALTTTVWKRLTSLLILTLGKLSIRNDILFSTYFRGVFPKYYMSMQEREREREREREKKVISVYKGR